MEEQKLKVLYLMTSGKTGGIERLCVDISKYSLHTNHFYFFWGGGICEEKIRENSKTIVRHVKYKRILDEFLFFRNYIIENDFDATIIQFPSPLILLFALLTKHRNLFLYLHSDPNVLFDSMLSRLLLKFIKKKIKGTICISEFVQDEYRGKDNTVVIYNGADLKNFVFQEKKEPRNKIMLVYVGRIVEEKGIQTLLHILKNVSFDYELTVVGDGNYLPALKELCNELALQNNVRFMGEQKDVAQWLNDADLFVHPAICKEGFGITLIEAMACGVPCLAYARGAVPEIITDGENGFLAETFQEAFLQKKLEEAANLFFKNKEQYNKIRYNARKRAECFSSTRYVENLSIYLEGKIDEN